MSLEEDANFKKMARLIHRLITKNRKPYLLAANAVMDKYGIPKTSDLGAAVSSPRGTYLQLFPMAMPPLKN